MTTTGEAPTQISDLRAETIAAIEQRDLLATETRRALIAAWKAGRICRTGCADALTGWGLVPPPGELTMSAHGQMSYARMHTDEDEAREEARQHVPDELDRALAGTEHHTVLTCAVEGYGIDQRLNPDTD